MISDWYIHHSMPYNDDIASKLWWIHSLWFANWPQQFFDVCWPCSFSFISPISSSSFFTSTASSFIVSFNCRSSSSSFFSPSWFLIHIHEFTNNCTCTICKRSAGQNWSTGTLFCCKRTAKYSVAQTQHETAGQNYTRDPSQNAQQRQEFKLMRRRWYWWLQWFWYNDHIFFNQNLTQKKNPKSKTWKGKKHSKMHAHHLMPWICIIMPPIYDEYIHHLMHQMYII